MSATTKTGGHSRVSESRRSSGFPIGHGQGQVRADQPRQLPKRPKGRLFVGLLLISLLLAGGYVLWDGFFRYDLYGMVEGRVFRVATTGSGLVKAVHVREGEVVRQGQLLVTLENLQLEQDVDRLGDELEIARATLDAELAKLRLSLQIEGDRRHKALAELYELAGTLQKEEAALADLELQRKRSESLRQKRAVPEAQYDAARLAAAGQRAKIEKLCLALEQLEERASATGTEPDEGHGQLKPVLARIESLQREIVRKRAQLQRCEVRSPVSGVVVKRYFLPGEIVEPSETVIEILEEESLEAVVYFPPDKTSSLATGQRIPLVIPGSTGVVEAVVTRLGTRFEQVPAPMARHYQKNEAVLPVHLRPQPRPNQDVRLRLGGLVRVPLIRPLLTPGRDSGISPAEISMKKP
jgi:membrane fusion protein (multidrug efflux system)